MGIDLHKETHTAVMLDCWNQKLGEITFENKPSEFSKLTRKVSRFVTEEKEPVYGLENAYGYGRALAVWLIEKGVAVKDVNTALSYAQRKSVPMYQKSDSYDAEAVALVLINMLDKLPDAIPDDKYWTLSQLVNRRDNICTHLHCLKNQLHEQLCIAYPSYKQFFSDISRATALYFFMEYPSPEHLQGKTAEELAEELEAGASLPPSGASACAEASTVSPSGRSALSEERIALIQERVDTWCVQRGYKDYSVNFMTLSRSLSISKADLAVYFSQRLHTTFRVWLSDIRFRAAQSMMLEHPHYSNDVISAECGFSSRTQLYRIFKAKVGCTPTAWRERQSQQDLLGR